MSNPRYITKKEIEKIKEYLNYNPKTGIFTWIKSKRRRIKGRIAGSLNDGYLSIEFNYISYRINRLAWVIYYGKNPKNQIDHINGIKTDNRIKNLRDVTCQENIQNTRKNNSRSKSKLLGAFFVREGKYVSSIGFNKKTYQLGVFKTAADAHKAYLKAKRKLHKGCTI